MMRRTAATLVLLAMSGLGTYGQASQAPQPSTLDERDARSLNLTAYAELLTCRGCIRRADLAVRLQSVRVDRRVRERRHG